MSRATDPIEGYYAQQTDTSTRDLFDKDKGLTPTPTARELLTLLGMEDTVETLAARVEAVLVLPRTNLRPPGWNDCLDEVRRVLDGGKP